MRLDEQTGRTIARSVNRRLVARGMGRRLMGRGFRPLPWLEYAVSTLERGVGGRLVGSGIFRADLEAIAIVVEPSKISGALGLVWYAFSARPKPNMASATIVEFSEHAIARFVERAHAFVPANCLSQELRGIGTDRLLELVDVDSLTELVTPSGRFPLTRDGDRYIAKTFIPN